MVVFVRVHWGFQSGLADLLGGEGMCLGRGRTEVAVSPTLHDAPFALDLQNIGLPDGRISWNVVDLRQFGAF